MTNENPKEHNAEEVLKYISEHERDLKYAVKKNITYDRDIFDEVWQTSILKIYDSVIRNKKIVTDFKNFCFICFKQNYINAQNRHRKISAQRIDMDSFRECNKSNPEFAYEYEFYESEEEEPTPEEKLQLFICDIKENFGDLKSEIFMTYYRYKVSHKKISFKELSEIFNVTPDCIRTALREIELYVKSGSAPIKSFPLF